MDTQTIQLRAQAVLDGPRPARMAKLLTDQVDEGRIDLALNPDDVAVCVAVGRALCADHRVRARIAGARLLASLRGMDIRLAEIIDKAVRLDSDRPTEISQHNHDHQVRLKQVSDDIDRIREARRVQVERG